MGIILIVPLFLGISGSFLTIVLTRNLLTERQKKEGDIASLVGLLLAIVAGILAWPSDVPNDAAIDYLSTATFSVFLITYSPGFARLTRLLCS